MKKNSFFSKNLKTYLFANDITHEELAGKLGLKAHGTIGRWINENRIPPGPTLQNISRVTGVPEDDFVNTDLTWQIIIKSDYTLVAAEPADLAYEHNSKIKMMARHIEETVEQLRLLEKAGEKVLEAVKLA